MIRLKIDDRNEPDPFEIPIGRNSWQLNVESLNQQLMNHLMTHFIKFE